MPVLITISRPSLARLASLGPRWDALAERAGASFFQRWTWVGALAAERYPRPVLIEAAENGQTVGLALANRTGWPPMLHLHESGDPAWDSVFIEHNGPVVMPDRPDVLRAMLAALRPALLSGVGDGVRDAARGLGDALIQTRLAPFRDLAAPDPVSRNTRQQLARSARAYGDVTVAAAAAVAQARDWFTALMALHTARWAARGQPGAFASPGVVRFHHALIGDGVPAGTVQLLRVAAGSAAVGYLYNFRAGGTVYAYQSGFDYAGVSGMQKPGLTSHAAAIGWYQAQGYARYDFLAGDSQYKRSLASGAVPLHWMRLRPAWDPRAISDQIIRRSAR